MTPGIEKNYQIFIVSKDEDSISTITRVFSDSLYTITITKSGMEVLSLISYKLPHIILIGTDIADINAFELVSLIKKNSITRYVPCIVFGQNNEIHDRISAIDAGADGYLAVPFKNEELHSLVHAKLVQHDELYLLSVTDDLTGLFTRKEFFRRFSFEIESHIHSCVCIAIIDIDHFKNINDTYGHPIGDIVLIQLANMLKSLQSNNFTPARFGGEEFVVIFPGLQSNEAKKIIDRIRLQFSSISFKTNTPDKTFSVSFSAGISEYPSMGTNLSELLSRADQALYSAKTDGRNRVYTFSPIMSRNDKFWEYIKTNKAIKNIFIDPFLHEPVTGYHYLPVVLENLLSFETSIDAIGVLIIKIMPLIDFYQYRGYKNFEYDIENIALLIPKICEIHFPYERYVTVADLYDYEIAILFPFPSTLKTNISEFNKLCKEIVLDISLQSIHHHIDIHYAHGVVPFHKNRARKILQEIKSIKSYFAPLLSLPNEANIVTSFLHAIHSKKEISDYLFFMPVYTTSFKKTMYHVLSKQLVSAKNFFDIMTKNAITAANHYMQFISSLSEIMIAHHIQLPVIINWISAIDLSLQIETLHTICTKLSLKKVILAIDEIDLNSFSTQFERLSLKNNSCIEFAVSNCYIGSNLLQYLSTIEFSMVILSEHMIRNIHYFKDRIKIINGLRLFCDQINLPLYAPNILKDEEYRIIKDIYIAYSSGPYIEQQFSLFSAASKTV
ncbi:MAG: diguanylate cyclase [Spirochaetes bacterium]|nr:diguanylate cyclase [Spirochaetota bacterium]